MLDIDESYVDWEDEVAARDAAIAERQAIVKQAYREHRKAATLALRRSTAALKAMNETLAAQNEEYAAQAEEQRERIEAKKRDNAIRQQEALDHIEKSLAGFLQPRRIDCDRVRVSVEGGDGKAYELRAENVRHIRHDLQLLGKLRSVCEMSHRVAGDKGAQFRVPNDNLTVREHAIQTQVLLLAVAAQSLAERGVQSSFDLRTLQDEIDSLVSPKRLANAHV